MVKLCLCCFKKNEGQGLNTRSTKRWRIFVYRSFNLGARSSSHQENVEAEVSANYTFQEFATIECEIPLSMYSYTK